MIVPDNSIYLKKIDFATAEGFTRPYMEFSVVHDMQ